jgi:predicted tellurium resistance membrane protein TerC
MRKLSRFISWFLQWLSELKMLAIVILATIGYFLWLLTMFTLFFVNPVYNVLWIPIPLIIAVLIWHRSEKKSDIQKAEEERARTKKI